MKTKLGALVLIAGVIMGTIGASDSGGCDNDGIGHKGRVLARTDSKLGKSHTYRLKIKDETKGVITFTVDRGVYKDCSAGEYYPGCKVKW